MAGGPRAKAWIGDACVGLTLAACGLVYWSFAQNLSVGAGDTPGPGAFPRFLGLAIAVAGLGCAARAWFARDVSQVAWAEKRAAAAAAALLIAAFAFEPLGFVATLSAFLGFQFWLLAGLGIARACFAGLGVTGGLWLIFDYALNIGLPDGPWGF